ncbi:MAG TPA: ABC transporter permease [Terriglobales bacterium]|nr:ABC transporter permease [Terriglobales bacterium]
MNHRDRHMRDLQQDIREHIAEATEENIARGMSPDEARYAALRKFGNVTQATEATREVWTVVWAERLLHDVRYALRMLRRAPGFTAVAVLTLALGIGANTAVFSVVYRALLRPLPYRDSGRLVVLNETTPKVGLVSVSYPDFLDWRAQSHSFAEMAAIQALAFNLSGVTEPESISGEAVTPNLLGMLGVQPILGRDFAAAEEQPGAAPVAILSYSLWQRRFAGSPSALGSSITLNGRSYTVIGVLPADFMALNPTDVLIPIGVWIADNQKEAHERGDRGDLPVIGRLAPGVTWAQARSEMQGIAAELARQYPGTNEQFGVSLQSVRDVLVGSTRPALLVLLTAVVFVLLIACANVANLLLVRGTGRTREMALRIAFGASRSRIFVQMITESAVLAMFGGVLGLAVAAAGVRAIAKLVPAGLLPAGDIRPNAAMLLFTTAVVMLAALAFGIAPSLHFNRSNLQAELKESGRTSSAGAAHGRLRGALAISEAALALVLLVGAGLMMKSLYRLLQVDPGFQPDRVLAMTISLRPERYSTSAARRNFWQEVLERVRALPGVESAAVATNLPLTDNHDRSDIRIEGVAEPSPGNFPHPDVHSVSPDYARTLGIALVRGRTFTESDSETAPLVAIVNQRLANEFFPHQDPIGKRFAFGHTGTAKWLTIVGVVSDTRLYGLANPSRLEVYRASAQAPSGQMELAVRSAVDPAALTSAVRGAVHSVDKDQAIAAVNTMSQLLNDSVATRRITLVLLALFSGLALVLGTIGIYGVVSYSVAQRTREIGVRMALGAPRERVFRLVIGQGLKLVGTGVAIGIVAALGLARFMAGLLYNVSAADAETFSLVALLLLVVTVAGCYVPARAAMSVDPNVALRYE